MLSFAAVQVRAANWSPSCKTLPSAPHIPTPSNVATRPAAYSVRDRKNLARAKFFRSHNEKPAAYAGRVSAGVLRQPPGRPAGTGRLSNGSHTATASPRKCRIFRVSTTCPRLAAVAAIARSACPAPRAWSDTTSKLTTTASGCPCRVITARPAARYRPPPRTNASLSRRCAAPGRVARISEA